MPIKIDSTKAVAQMFPSGHIAQILPGTETTTVGCHGWTAKRGRWICETDWRRVMAVVRAAEYDMDNIATGLNTSCMSTREALDRLRGKGEKKCTHTARNASTKTT